jgi:fatty acid desaturase (delta-4 desaturase)
MVDMATEGGVGGAAGAGLVSADDGRKKSFTRAEVDKSPAEASLSVVGKYVYSVGDFAPKHPGGAMFPSFFGGKDATIAFATYHMRPWPETSMKKYLVGSLSDKETAITVGEDYYELAKLVRKELGPKGGFAPARYYFKVAGLAACTLWVEVHMLLAGHRSLWGSLVQGLCYAWLGLNVMHDANHGAVSRRPAVNRVLGLAQDWIGGSSCLWIHQHVVNHHIHCNHEELDPDIQGDPLFRLYPRSPWKSHHRLQHVYFWVLILAYGLKIALLDFTQLANKEWSGMPMSRLAHPYWPLSVALKLFFYIRFFGLPLILSDSILHTMLMLGVTATVSGAYLSFFFMLSHNFEGAITYEGKAGIDGGEKEYLLAVLETSSNVGGRGLCYLNGGLNYQVEHHLFPRIHHSNYPTIAPIVRQFCKERELPYFHFPSISENVSALMIYLMRLGRAS